MNNFSRPHNSYCLSWKPLLQAVAYASSRSLFSCFDVIILSI